MPVMSVSYTYTVLRYMHDITTEEVVNVGIVLYSAEQKHLCVRIRNTYGRLSRFFAGMDGEALKRQLREIERGLDGLARKPLFLSDSSDVVKVVSQILPKDDSALQWGDLKGGISSNLEETADRLYARNVTQYEETQKRERRTERDVWKDFCKDLPDHSFEDKVEKVVLESSFEKKEFLYSYKFDSKIFCFEPVSFDLSDEEYIADKTHRLIGSYLSLLNGKEDMKIIFLVGEPVPKLMGQYNKAIRKLKEFLPPSCEVIPEAQKSVFSELVGKLPLTV